MAANVKQCRTHTSNFRGLKMAAGNDDVEISAEEYEELLRLAGQR